MAEEKGSSLIFWARELALNLENRVVTGTLVVGTLLFALCLPAAGQAPMQIQIRVLNAKNGERVANQKVSVAIKGTKNATEYTTDAEGNISVNLPSDAEVFAATEWWTTCRKVPGEGYGLTLAGDVSTAFLEKGEIYDFVREHGITGFATVAGDRHAFWAGLSAKSLPPQKFEPVPCDGSQRC